MGLTCSDHFQPGPECGSGEQPGAEVDKFQPTLTVLHFTDFIRVVDALSGDPSHRASFPPPNGGLARCWSPLFYASVGKKGERGSDASVGNGRDVNPACHSWT